MLVICLSILQSLFGILSSRTLDTDFTLTVQQNMSQPISYGGHLRMHGRLFELAGMGTEAAYDGSTLYIYNTDANELTLSTPTEDELMTANPLLFAMSLAEVSKVTEQTSGALTTVKLTPPADSGVEQITLTVRMVGEDLMPEKIVMREQSKQITTLILRAVKYTEEVTDYLLAPDGAFINDLR